MAVIRQGGAEIVERDARFRDALGLSRTHHISDAGGLGQFGAYLEVLEPGARSSERHWHEAEDEFLYMLSGVATVIEDGAAQVIGPGDACCWPAGVPIAHQVLNHGAEPCAYLIVGTRAASDRCHYPDRGETLAREGASWAVLDAATGATLRSGRDD